MIHYIHLYFSYMKRSFISRLEYKKDTFIAMMGFFIENAASIASIYFVVNSIPSLNGYTIWQIGFLYGFVMIPRGMLEGLPFFVIRIASNLWLLLNSKRASSTVRFSSFTT